MAVDPSQQSQPRNLMDPLGILPQNPYRGGMFTQEQLDEAIKEALGSQRDSQKALEQQPIRSYTQVAAGILDSLAQRRKMGMLLEASRNMAGNRPSALPADQTRSTPSDTDTSPTSDSSTSSSTSSSTPADDPWSRPAANSLDPYSGPANVQGNATPSPNADALTIAKGTTSRGETSHKFGVSALANISRDTNNSFSYGPWGVNSKTGSAGEFVKAHPELGLTGQPGTPEFNNAWQNVARTNPDAMLAAHDAWYKTKYFDPVTPTLTAAGVPQNIASDPRVQTFFADRNVQMGKVGFNNAIAAARGAQDPVGFLRAVHQADTQNIPRNFPSYLRQFPNNYQGLVNRNNNRFRDSLSSGQTASQPSAGATPSPAGQPPSGMPPATGGTPFVSASDTPKFTPGMVAPGAQTAMLTPPGGAVPPMQSQVPSFNSRFPPTSQTPQTITGFGSMGSNPVGAQNLGEGLLKSPQAQAIINAVGGQGGAAPPSGATPFNPTPQVQGGSNLPTPISVPSSAGLGAARLGSQAQPSPQGPTRVAALAPTQNSALPTTSPTGVMSPDSGSGASPDEEFQVAQNAPPGTGYLPEGFKNMGVSRSPGAAPSSPQATTSPSQAPAKDDLGIPPFQPPSKPKRQEPTPEDRARIQQEADQIDRLRYTNPRQWEAAFQNFRNKYDTNEPDHTQGGWIMRGNRFRGYDPIGVDPKIEETYREKTLQAQLDLKTKPAIAAAEEYAKLRTKYNMSAEEAALQASIEAGKTAAKIYTEHGLSKEQAETQAAIVAAKTKAELTEKLGLEPRIAGETTRAQEQAKADVKFGTAEKELELERRKKEQTEVGEAAGKLAGSAVTKGAAAGDTIRALDALMAISNLPESENITSGPLAETFLKYKETLNNFFPGLGLAKEAAPAETINKLNAYLSSASVHELTNRGTQFDFRTFLQNNPSLALTPEGRAMTADILKQMALQDAELGKRMIRADPRDFYDIQKDVYEKNPIKIHVGGREVNTSDPLPGYAKPGAKTTTQTIPDWKDYPGGVQIRRKD